MKKIWCISLALFFSRKHKSSHNLPLKYNIKLLWSNLSNLSCKPYNYKLCQPKCQKLNILIQLKPCLQMKSVLMDPSH